MIIRESFGSILEVTCSDLTDGAWRAASCSQCHTCRRRSLTRARTVSVDPNTWTWSWARVSVLWFNYSAAHLQRTTPAKLPWFNPVRAKSNPAGGRFPSWTFLSHHRLWSDKRRQSAQKNLNFYQLIKRTLVANYFDDEFRHFSFRNMRLDIFGFIGFFQLSW